MRAQSHSKLVVRTLLGCFDLRGVDDGAREHGDGQHDRYYRWQGREELLHNHGSKPSINNSGLVGMLAGLLPSLGCSVLL